MYCLTSPSHFHCDLSWTNLTRKWDLLLITPGNKEPDPIRVYFFAKAYFKRKNYRIQTPKPRSYSSQAPWKDTEDAQA